MFDYIRYEGYEYQSRDTPAQSLDNYEIRDDNSLWHEEYDLEWREEKLSLLGGYFDKINPKWIFQEDFTGEIRFYRSVDDTREWIEYSSYFSRGKLIKIEEI